MCIFCYWMECSVNDNDIKLVGNVCQVFYMTTDFQLPVQSTSEKEILQLLTVIFYLFTSRNINIKDLDLSTHWPHDCKQTP